MADATNKHVDFNGDVTYWVLGTGFHRTDGPAIEWTGGEIRWYWNGVRYSFNEYVNVAGWSDEQIVMYKLQYF